MEVCLAVAMVMAAHQALPMGEHLTMTGRERERTRFNVVFFFFTRNGM